MEKLVITYGGSYEYGADILCLEYESAEALLRDIQEQFDNYMKNQEICQEQYKDFKKKMNAHIATTKKRTSKTQQAEDVKTFWEIENQRPKWPDEHIKIGGIIFRVPDFINHMTDKPNRDFCPPEILTLNEWFEENKEWFEENKE